MTLSNITNRVEYIGDAVEDTFAYIFKIFVDSDLDVYVAGVLQTITTHYTVTDAGEDNGGSVVFEAGSIPGSGDLVEIIRELPITQTTDYVEGGDFLANSHEFGLDRLIMIAQRLLGKIVAFPFVTLANEATPTVAGKRNFITGGTTTITDFDDGVTGQIIHIVSEHAITITDGTNIFLDGSANWTMAATDTLTLICKADNKWYELGRSDNT